MNYFTRQWWFIDSVTGEIGKKADEIFAKYNLFVEGLASSGVPVQKELACCCSLHGHVVTRVSFSESSLDFIVRNGDSWAPYLLSFPHPEKVMCIRHENGEEHIFFDLTEMIGAGIGYCEYGAMTKDIYKFSMIFDLDFSIDIDLSESICFQRITDKQADDGKVSNS